MPFIGTITFANNAQNMAITCPRGHVFDPTHNVDGTYSTEGGYFHRVRTVMNELAAADREDLVRLRQRLVRAQAMESEDDARTALQEDPAAPSSLLSLFRPTTHSEMMALVRMVVIAIGILLAGGYMVASEQDQALEQLLEHVTGVPVTDEADEP